MKFVVKHKIAIFYALAIFFGLSLVSAQYSIQYLRPEQCKTVQLSYAYFFNVTHLICSPCAQNITYQNTSTDGENLTTYLFVN
jgi:hypothetical protein